MSTIIRSRIVDIGGRIGLPISLDELSCWFIRDYPRPIIYGNCWKVTEDTFVVALYSTNAPLLVQKTLWYMGTEEKYGICQLCHHWTRHTLSSINDGILYICTNCDNIISRMLIARGNIINRIKMAHMSPQYMFIANVIPCIDDFVYDSDGHKYCGALYKSIPQRSYGILVISQYVCGDLLAIIARFLMLRLLKEFYVGYYYHRTWNNMRLLIVG